MKLLVVIYLLGASLNFALALEPEAQTIINPIAVESIEEESEPKFTNLVKSTMDLLGPIDEVEEITVSEETQTQAISQAE